MKTYKSTSKNLLYFCYRLINQLVDPIRLFKGLWGYIWYIGDFIKFKRLNRKSEIKLLDIYPILHDKTEKTELDAHYFYQQLWVFEKVLKTKPKEHVDVGSTYQMSGYLSKIVPTTFIDIRPIDVKLKNLQVKDASILNLPYEDSSLESISCLHVIEHIGLGRYGGKIDPDGWRRACKELQRVLAKNGKLYISVPIGKPRICFNAHRVFSLKNFIKEFDKSKLIKLSVVDDRGQFIDNTKKRYEEAAYSLGLIELQKK